MAGDTRGRYLEAGTLSAHGIGIGAEVLQDEEALRVRSRRLGLRDRRRAPAIGNRPGDRARRTRKRRRPGEGDERDATPAIT